MSRLITSSGLWNAANQSFSIWKCWWCNYIWRVLSLLFQYLSAKTGRQRLLWIHNAKAQLKQQQLQINRPVIYEIKSTNIFGSNHHCVIKRSYFFICPTSLTDNFCVRVWKKWKNKNKCITLFNCLYDSTHTFKYIMIIHILSVFFFNLNSLEVIKHSNETFSFCSFSQFVGENIHILNPWKPSGDLSVHSDNICQDIYQQNSNFCIAGKIDFSHNYLPLQKCIQ